MYFQLFWEFCACLSFVKHHFVFILVLKYLEEEEKAGCFIITCIVLQMYYHYKCSVALPHGALGCLQYLIVVFPDHTYSLFARASTHVDTFFIFWFFRNTGF